jgi:ubiquinone/menaquinone biosynthesis C-methylase UbiE
MSTSEQADSISGFDAAQGIKDAIRWLLGQWIFDAGAKIYDRVNSNPFWQENCAQLVDGMDSKRDGLVVLDLGVGPGVSAMSMGQRRKGLHFIGLDISEQMLDIALENREKNGWSQERLSLLRGNALILPLADDCVDAATGHSFLYLLPDHRTALEEAHRVVRSGGYVAFLEPYSGQVDWGWLFRQKSGPLILSLILWRFYNWIHGRFSEQSMTLELERAGFTHVETEVTLGGFGIFGRAEKP